MTTELLRRPNQATSPINALRASLLRGMLRAMTLEILPELSSSTAIDTARSLMRTLSLLTVDEEWSDVATGEYCKAANAEMSVATTAVQRREWSREQLADLAADDSSFRRYLFAERTVQQTIADQCDAAVAATQSLSAEQQTTAHTNVVEVLNAYFRERFFDGDIPQVLAATLLPGGRSKFTYRLALTPTSRLPTLCILRLDRKEGLLATCAADEFKLLQVLWTAKIPVPQPFLVEKNVNLLGGTFILVGHIAGAKAGEYFPEVDGCVVGKTPLGLDIARILGGLHSLPLSVIPTAAETPPLSIDNVRNRIETIYTQARSIGVRMVEFEIAHQWLLQNILSATGVACFQHGDVGLHNMIMCDDHIVGLLDWELATAGTAAADLAACRHLVQVLMPWPQFAEAYVAAGGPLSALADQHLLFHTVLRAFATVGVSQQCAHLYATGKTTDFVLANAGFDSATRARRLLVETLCEVFETSHSSILSSNKS